MSLILFSRHNTNDNAGEGMPAIHVQAGDAQPLPCCPRGPGGERFHGSAMLLPSQKNEIEKFVAETMLLAEGKPCPPVVLGVGIGGTFDGAAALAKEALLLPIDEMTPFEQLSSAMQ